MLVKVDEVTGRVISGYPGGSGAKVDTYYGTVGQWNLDG